MRKGWNVVLRHDECFQRVNLWLIKENMDGSQEIALPVDLTITKKLDNYGEISEPTIRFNGHQAHEFLQDLSNGLAEIGYRPDELKASDKELKAVNYHLEDMRKLIFNKELK